MNRYKPSNGRSLTDMIKSMDFYRMMPSELTEPTVSGASSKNKIFNDELKISFNVCNDGAYVPVYQLIC